LIKLLATLIVTVGTLISIGQTKEFYDRIADSLIRVGKADSLIPYFQNELKSNPKSEDVLRMLGYLFIVNKQPDLGEKYYRQALVINPGCVRCFMNLGKIYITRSDYIKASELFDQAIIIDPNDPILFSERAQLREIKGEKFAALIDYNKSVELDPLNHEYYLLRGRFYSKEGRFSLALSDLNKAIELVPNHSAPYFERSQLFYDSRMFEEALNDANYAIIHDSTQYQMYVGRGAIYTELKLYERAILDYSKAIAHSPEDFYSYYQRSLNKYKLEDMEGFCGDVHLSLSILMKNDPVNQLKSDIEYSVEVFCDSTKASYYYQRGIAFYNLRQFDKAVDIYSKGVKKFPKNAMLLSFRGNAYFALEEYSMAIADYEASIENKENVFFDIEINKRHTGLSADSLQLYLTGFVAGMQISMAESLFALGHYDEALIEINKGLYIAPEMREIGKEIYYNVRGNIYLALGKYLLALNDFDKCIQINPGFPLAYVNRAVAKINLSSKIHMKTYSIRSGESFQTFNPNWTMPLKASVKKSDENITSALTDCNTAIEIEPNLDFAYYMRGRIKKMLVMGDYCYDLMKSKDLGYPVELSLINSCLR
jgi:tetratricopeptide (TPR) repeat protein